MRCVLQQWLVALTLLCGLGAAPCIWADDDLAARVQRLPVSVGENRVITRPRGESWLTIGLRERVGHDALLRANPRGLCSRTLLIPGRHQVTPPPADGLTINLPEMMVCAWEQGTAVNWYPIAIGQIARRWHTPVGALRVVNKWKHPAWHRPDWAGGGVMPPGPRNPLGDRWIGLSRPGYGLHGTNTPSSIGRSVSHGCIRMFPAHVRQLFDWVTIGMPVVITYETVTVGYQRGTIYLAIFPDIYQRGTNKPGAARARLAALGLDGILSEDALRQRLTEADGVARPLLGSSLPVTLNGVPLALPIGPTGRDGRLYLPLRPLVQAVGAAVGWDAATRTVTVSRGEATALFPLTEAGAFTALDTVFVPARTLAERLGGTVDVTTERLNLTIRKDAHDDDGTDADDAIDRATPAGARAIR